MKDQIIKLLDDWKGQQQKEHEKSENRTGKVSPNFGQHGPRIARLCPAPDSGDINYSPSPVIPWQPENQSGQHEAVPEAPLTDFPGYAFSQSKRRGYQKILRGISPSREGAEVGRTLAFPKPKQKWRLNQ